MDEKNQEIIEKVLAYKLEEHPTLPSPNKRQRLEMIENIGPEKVLDLFLMRENKIKAELNDPMRYGHELPHWPDADKLLGRFNEIVVLGGNRSGKTEYAAKRMAQAFIGTDLNGQAPDWVKERHGKRNIRIWCLHTTHMTSVSAQQNVFYKYLPPEIRNIKRTNHTQISFSQKNGFSDNTAVYMGNQIWFLNYAQDIKVVEGGEVDYVWCDELVPQNWLETLRYRLVTRSGKLIVTFTPVQGYTQVVKEYINSAKVTVSRPSPLLPNHNVLTVPKGEMPYQAENLYGRHA
jgi:phage terminase large subunit-like protein